MKINSDLGSNGLRDKSLKKIIRGLLPYFLLVGAVLSIAYKFVNPAPPDKIVISTGNGEGDYLSYAKAYQEIMQKEGVQLEIRTSTGSFENLNNLRDPESDVDVGFVQDGLADENQDSDLVSLGSLYYEPMWVFYPVGHSMNRFSQMKGKKIAVGEIGSGTETLALRLLSASGVSEQNTTLIHLNWENSAAAIRQGKVDAAFFIATAEDPLIEDLIGDRDLQVMDVDQAEAVTKHLPFLHHLLLPKGAIDLGRNLPDRDLNLLAPTATLVAREDLHPALVFLLLKAATKVHSQSGIFEKKNEFPSGKDYELPLAGSAQQFYKTGAPFWQKYLPFWLATLVERFILVVLPLLALIYPLIKLIPQWLAARVRSRIYLRYGELKKLEAQIQKEMTHEKYPEHIVQLNLMDQSVHAMKVPLDFADAIYGFREHIDFVRSRLRRDLALDAEGESRKDNGKKLPS